MQKLKDTLWFCSAVFVMAMTAGLIYQGLDSLYYYKQLQLNNTTPTAVLNKLNGCRINYHTCKIKVVGSDPKLLTDQIRPVKVPSTKQPYKF